MGADRGVWVVLGGSMNGREPRREGRDTTGLLWRREEKQPLILYLPPPQVGIIRSGTFVSSVETIYTFFTFPF